MVSPISKGILLSLFLLCFMFPSDCTAQDYKSSIGARLGTYFAGSYKAFLSEKGAIEGVIGIARDAGSSNLAIGGLYQVHNSVTADLPMLRWYFGAGSIITRVSSTETKLYYALTANIGMEYTLDHAPVNFFIDGIPYYNLNEDDGFNVQASVGVRYILKSDNH